MTDITPAVELARENARTSTGQFGTQQHTAPELTLTVTDPKQEVVDRLLAERIGSFPDAAITPEALSMGDLRQLMLDAIDQYQEKHPTVVVIDGNRESHGAPGVELIDLDYLGEYYDDGNGPDYAIQRATEDLDRLRAAGLDRNRAGWQLREHIYQNLDVEWIWSDNPPILGGRYGEVVIEEFHNTDEVKARDIFNGAVISTYPNYAAAKAVFAPASENR